MKRIWKLQLSKTNITGVSSPFLSIRCWYPKPFTSVCRVLAPQNMLAADLLIAVTMSMWHCWHSAPQRTKEMTGREPSWWAASCRGEQQREAGQAAAPFFLPLYLADGHLDTDDTCLSSAFKLVSVIHKTDKSATKWHPMTYRTLEAPQEPFPYPNILYQFAESSSHCRWLYQTTDCSSPFNKCLRKWLADLQASEQGSAGEGSTGSFFFVAALLANGHLDAHGTRPPQPWSTSPHLHMDTAPSQAWGNHMPRSVPHCGPTGSLRICTAWTEGVPQHPSSTDPTTDLHMDVHSPWT